MVAKRGWGDGKPELAVLGEKVDGLFSDLSLYWSFFFKSGQQFAHGTRIEQRTGQAVLADLAGFLKHVDVLFAELRVRVLGIVLIDKLRQAQSTCHPCRTTTNNNNVGGHLWTFYAFDRFSEDQHRFQFQVSGFKFQVSVDVSTRTADRPRRRESMSPFRSRRTSELCASTFWNSEAVR